MYFTISQKAAIKKSWILGLACLVCVLLVYILLYHFWDKIDKNNPNYYITSKVVFTIYNIIFWYFLLFWEEYNTKNKFIILVIMEIIANLSLIIYYVLVGKTEPLLGFGWKVLILFVYFVLTNKTTHYQYYIFILLASIIISSDISYDFPIDHFRFSAHFLSSINENPNFYVLLVIYPYVISACGSFFFPIIMICLIFIANNYIQIRNYPKQEIDNSRLISKRHLLFLTSFLLFQILCNVTSNVRYFSEIINKDVTANIFSSIFYILLTIINIVFLSYILFTLVKNYFPSNRKAS